MVIDGSPAKTQKSKLFELLENDVAPVDSIPSGAALIIDAMATLQALVSPAATFGEVA